MVSWPIGLIILIGIVIIAISAATMYLAFTHPRFKDWIEFGENVKVHSFSGTKVYRWCDVVSISYEYNMETGKEAVLTLSRSGPLQEKFDPSELENIAESLSTGLHSQEAEIRESVVHGLNRLGCTESLIVGPAGSRTHSYDRRVAEMRKVIVSHVEKVLDDSYESVRAAAADALSSIRLRISEEQSRVCRPEP